MTKEEIFKAIIDWEQEAGESFTDYFSSGIDGKTFMTWCFGKGYISREQFNQWVEAWSKKKLESNCSNYFVYNEYGNKNAPFAVVITEEYSDEAQEKAYKILAEFISGIDVYITRLNKFLSEYEEA